MPRPLDLGCLLLATFSAILASCGRSGSGAARPRHLILVTIDTLRADHVSSFGSARPTTAAATAGERGSVVGFTIDEMAGQGVKFVNAFAPRGSTFPSMATLFTGLSPLEHCAYRNGDTLPTEAFTLAERLREAGYRTAGFSSNKLLAPSSGIDQGFETFLLDASEEKDERVVQAAQEWLSAQDPAGPPVFVWIHLMGPHLPYEPAPIGAVDFARLFASADYGGQADGSRAFLDSVHADRRELSAEDLRHVVGLYDGEVARVDHLVSRFLAYCAGKDERRPVDWLSDALLVFAADHGEELYERNGYFGHGKSVYATVLRVPLLLRHPGSLPVGRAVTDIVSTEDLLPTLFEILGLAAPAPVHGRSIADLVRGTARLESRPTFGLWRDRIVSVRDGRWRLVWTLEGGGRAQPAAYPIPETALFDVEADPGETRDVAGEHPEVVAGLKRAVEEWLSGLRRCGERARGPSPEQMQALRELGYVGDER